MPTDEWTRLERDDEALYRGARLAEAGALRERDPEALNAAELAFLDASVAREEAARRKELDDARALAAAQRRAKRNIARGALAALAGAVAAVVLAIAAIGESRTADRQRDVAVSQQLGTVALDRLRTNPEQALLIAREAAAQSRTQQAEAALRAALASPLEAVLDAGAPTDHILVAISRDGRVAATSGADARVRVWDLERAESIAVLAPRLGELSAIAVDRTGGSLLLAEPLGAETLGRLAPQVGRPVARKRNDPCPVRVRPRPSRGLRRGLRGADLGRRRP